MAYEALKGRYSLKALNRRLKAIWQRQAETATITVGEEDTDVINVAVQLKDANGTAVAATQVVQAFLSDDSAGADIATTAPDGGTAAGTNGFILVEDVAEKLFTIETKSDGSFDIDITESGTATWYLVVVLPNGKVSVSGAITFAA